MSSEPHDPSDDSPRPLVRVMLALQFGGAAVMLLVCWLEWRTGVISPWDRWLLPSVAVVIAASAALGQVHPAWEGELRLVTVSAFNLYLGFSLLATLEIGPQTSQWYQTITTLLWMPLGYGCAFVFLRPRLALLVSGVTACGVFGPLLLWDLQDRLPAWTHENGPLLPVAGLAQAMYVVLLMAFVHLRSSNERARVHMRTMHELARTDMLTTLPNRRAVTETLSASIGALRGTGRPFAVVLVDLDHFKQVNDRHGHDAGDASRTTTLASRFSSSDSGSMFELPTVAQSSSTTATLACRKAGVYSKMRTPWRAVRRTARAPPARRCGSRSCPAAAAARARRGARPGAGCGGRRGRGRSTARRCRPACCAPRMAST
jgi:hypothetical protein